MDWHRCKGTSDERSGSPIPRSSCGEGGQPTFRVFFRCSWLAYLQTPCRSQDKPLVVWQESQIVLAVSHEHSYVTQVERCICIPVS